MNKSERYEKLYGELAALLAGESDLVANAANMSALIWQSLPGLSWAGFYLMKDGEIVLGPFQGKPACVRISTGRGVCGTVASTGKSLIVPDVRAFPGHIACDAASRSEIVLPLFREGMLIALLDLDSPEVGRFDEEDQRGLESLVALFLENLA